MQTPPVTDAMPRTKPLWLKVAATISALTLALTGYLAFNAQKAVPDATFVSLSGEKISLRSLRGKVVMINFWSTSCAICIREMPQMVETYNKFNGKGLEFIAVAMRGDRPDYVLDYAHTRRLPFKVALDVQGELAKAFGDVSMTPTTFVIDKEGNIVKRYVGQPEFPALHQLLEKTLAMLTG